MTMVSMGSAGSAAGSLIVGFLLEKVGRKYTLAASTFFTIVGALFQTIANSVSLMIVGRLVAGVALGTFESRDPRLCFRARTTR
jgi:predicted MFS family arabinose efflux permease